METVGIRELKQNASAVVARVAAGERVTITDRGRPVATMIPVREAGVADLVGAGLARPPLRPLAELPPPTIAADGSRQLAMLRDDERY